MKKIISTFLLCFSSIILFSQSNSNLIIFSEDGYKFYLILNGIRQNEQPLTNVKVVDLNQPYYSAKIIFEDKTQPILEKKFLQVRDVESNGPLEVTYKIKKNNKLVNVLRFYSQVPITQAVPASQDVSVVHFNTTPMPEIETISVSQHVTTTTTSGNNANNNANISVGTNAMGVGINMNINIQDPTIHNNTTTTTTSYTTTTSSSNSNYNSNNQVVSQQTNNNSCEASFAMSATNFTAAKNTISKQSFDDTKLSTAKQVIKSNCLTAEQIKELMLLFSFEDTRLTLAKFAYNRCVDKNNYFILNDAFTFDSSVEELNKSLK